jgi:hypothetical protein
MEAKIERTWIEVVPDDGYDASYLYEKEPDFSDRREQYERGDFAFVGVRACAEIRFQTIENSHAVIETLRSPGIWSIESDSDEDYFREVGAEELSQIADMLMALHFGVGRVKNALDEAELTYRYQ